MHIREWAKKTLREATTLWFCLRHPQTPWWAKAVAFVVVAYALSPVDLIPDVIPVVGLLDDVLLIPLGVALVVKLMPPDVLQECRAQAKAHHERPRSKAGVVFVAATWLALIAAAWWAAMASGAFA